MRGPSGSVAAALLSAVALLAATGVGVLILHQFGTVELALSGAALSLALLIGAILLVRDRSARRRFAEMAGLRGEIRRLRLDFDRLGRSVEALEPREPEPRPKEPGEDLLTELEKLRRTLTDLAAGRDIEEPQAQPPRQAPPPFAFDPTLELYLEPVVSLDTGRTAHYRALTLLAAPDGRHVPYEEMAQRLNNHALRPPLDINCLARVLPLTRKLVLRRQNSLILVPIGGETLANAEAMRELARLLESDEGFAPAISFEIEHRSMAGLSAQGVEGLAALAQQGAAMALTGVAAEGVDLKALRDLHFAFLSFPATTLPRMGLGKPDWAPLAAFAGEHGFRTEVRGLDSVEQVSRAKKWAKLGSGPAFAPPRRVKSDGGAANPFTAAA